MRLEACLCDVRGVGTKMNVDNREKIAIYCASAEGREIPRLRYYDEWTRSGREGERVDEEEMRMINRACTLDGN
jgi:hypothetical protein